MGAGGVWKILAVAACVIGCGASPAMRTGVPLARPRTEVQVASEGTRLYVVGGYPKDADTRLDIYDAATGTWTSGAPLPVGRNHLALAAGGGSV